MGYFLEASVSMMKTINLLREESAHTCKFLHAVSLDL